MNCLGGLAAGQTSGDLPSNLVIIEEYSDCAGAIEEGEFFQIDSLSFFCICIFIYAEKHKLKNRSRHGRTCA